MPDELGNRFHGEAGAVLYRELERLDASIARRKDNVIDLKRTLEEEVASLNSLVDTANHIRETLINFGFLPRVLVTENA